MSDYTTVLNRVLSLENQFAAFIAGTLTMNDLTESQRRAFLTAIFKYGVYINADDPQIKSGDDIYGEGYDSVNDGNIWFGKALVDGPFIKSGAGAAQEDVDIEVKFG